MPKRLLRKEYLRDITKRYRMGHTLDEIALHYGVRSRNTIRKFLKEHKKYHSSGHVRGALLRKKRYPHLLTALRVASITNEANAKKGRTGRQHHNYRRVGSVTWTSNGYPEIKIGHRTWVRAHIWTVENHLGRKLQKGEHVHHINMDKNDYNLKNLMIVHGSSEHRKIHSSFNKLCSVLMHIGVVRFDRNLKKYAINPSFRKLLKNDN